MKKDKYIIGDESVDRIINELAEKFGSTGTKELYRQMLTTVIKLTLDGADTGDLKLLNTSLKELRHAFKIFSRYRKVKKVVIFGSARIKPSSKEYKMVAEFAEKISKLGFLVITGGGGGVMEAGNKGALPGKSFAVNIRLPLEQRPNPYIKQSEKLMSFNYFFTRKLIFIKESDATVLFPGGFGTNDEAFEVLTLAQTGKGCPRPIIFVNDPNSTYWNTWFKFLKHEAVSRGFLSENDLKIFRIVDTVDEAVNEVAGFYKVYQSTRYVKGKLVIRLKKTPTDDQLKMLNDQYHDILESGKIILTEPLPEEVRDKDQHEFPRILLHFNKRDYGRLFEMIREINNF